MALSASQATTPGKDGYFGRLLLGGGADIQAIRGRTAGALRATVGRVALRSRFYRTSSLELTTLEAESTIHLASSSDNTYSPAPFLLNRAGEFEKARPKKTDHL